MRSTSWLNGLDRIPETAITLYTRVGDSLSLPLKVPFSGRKTAHLAAADANVNPHRGNMDLDRMGPRIEVLPDGKTVGLTACGSPGLSVLFTV